MTDTDKAESSSAAEFNLKHRVTGAAVLLFLGALVIPWLLGPPSEASKQVAELDPADEQMAVTEIERELLGGGETAAEEPEETVYISKITPLSNQSENDVEDSSQDSNSGDSKTTDTAEKDTNKEAEAAKKLAREKAEAAEKQRQQNAKAEAERKAREKAAADKKAKADKESSAEELARQKREKELQAALAAEDEPSPSNTQNKVDVGWIVQVGLYLEKKGAEKKIAELKGQGFKPSNTVVDTNRGPKTGTRVWLGPFEKRPEAEKQNSKLKQKTGKDGFIRVYP